MTLWLEPLLSRAVSFRNLVLFRFAIAITYLWVAADFFIIARQREKDPVFSQLLPPPRFETFFHDQAWNAWFASWLDWLINPSIFFWLIAGSVIVAVCFALGRFPRLSQAGLFLMMILFGAEAPLFESSADAWLFWVLFLGIWAPNDPPFTPTRWKQNPVVESRYAALVVFLSFTVYFFAGCSKIAIGGDQWLGGTALQNIAYDHAVYAPLRGTVVPYWISLILCYYTLFQRLIVPFFFFLRRPWQIAAVVILGTMHVGYACLLHVSTFPALGLASLILIPTEPRALPLPVKDLSWARYWAIPGIAALMLMAVMPALQVSEKCNRSCAYLTHEIPRWSFAFYYPLRWEMFAAGGARDRDDWRFLIEKNHAETIDITHRIDPHLPSIWRTRFYRDSLDRSAYALSLDPARDVKKLDLSFQVYLFVSQNVYLEEGGPSSLYITAAHVGYQSGNNLVARVKK